MPTSATVSAAPRDKIAELIRDTTSADTHVRQAACQGLGSAARSDARLAPVLLKALKDRDPYVRQAATTSLGQVARRGDDQVVEALVAQLGDSDSAVRRLASTSLGQVSNRSSSRTVAALVGRLEDRDGGVRRAAVKALEKVADKEDPAVLPQLFARTADVEAFVRHTAVEVLSRLAEEGNSEVVERMLELLSDKDERVRWASTEALGRLAVRGDSRVLTRLLGRLDDESDSVRRAAATALGHVTFAPLQELELQERQIAELEFRGQHEVAARERTISSMRVSHAQETAKLRLRIDELEEKIRHEVARRDERIERLEAEVKEQDWVSRFADVIPHSGEIARFLHTLPDLAGPQHFGTQIRAPMWALRCLRHAPVERSPSTTRSATPWVDASPAGKDKRALLALFELFEQLSSGVVTPLELTEATPLDVFIHQTDDGTWGLFCSSRQRLQAFLMRQACCRNELLQVNCILRSKDDLSYWSWHWNSFYDGWDGRLASPRTAPSGSPRSESPTGRLRLSASSPRVAAGSSTSTPRSGRIPHRGGRPSPVGPPPPGQVAANAALAAAAAVFNGAEPPRRGGSSGTNSSTISISQLFSKGPSSSTKALSPRGSIRRTKSASNVATFGTTAPLRPVQRTVPSVSVELEK